MNPTNSIVYSSEPCTEVYCFRLNFNISKLGYSTFSFFVSFRENVPVNVLTGKFVCFDLCKVLASERNMCRCFNVVKGV